MHVWAIADLHLSFGVARKSMEVFGPEWSEWTKKIEERWRSSVKPDDLVLIAGDISWAKSLDEAKVDLEWIAQLPGTKVLVKGNHDYWWGSLNKVVQILPPSLHLIQNNAFDFKEVTVGGARLWDSDEFNFDSVIDFKKGSELPEKEEENKKIFQRELQRLEMSLQCLNPDASVRLAMTHYPPIGVDLKPSKVSELLEKYRVQSCVFGHLHNVKKIGPLFGEKRGVCYYLTSCDFLDFFPVKIY